MSWINYWWVVKVRINQISVPLDFDEQVLRNRVARKLGCPPALVSGIEVTRRSLDARTRNPEPVYVLSAVADLALDRLPHKAHRKDIEFLDKLEEEATVKVIAGIRDNDRPLVVGAGPAGLIAALELALAGARPVLIDRGDDSEGRAGKVNDFWKDGVLDSESNVLYGEGGAGLFSDGKLTARSKDRGRVRRFFQHLVDSGADPDILVEAEPHIGSDHLLQVVPEIRKRIIELGGEVRFRSRLEDLHIEGGELRGVTVNGRETTCSSCILAVGHSARDVYEMLGRRGVEIKAKPFAIGVRLELPQEQIDQAQYGRWARNPKLGAASFRLTRRAEMVARDCYSFCMCPGGKVMSCASEADCLTTNGMSYSRRSLEQGNAAFLVPVTPADFGDGPFAGVEFQRKIEAQGFAIGGSGYALPAVRLVDFLAERVSDIPESRSCGRAVPGELRDVLPDYVVDTLVFMIPRMLKQLQGVKIDDVLLYGPETRSSAPLRINRNDYGVSTTVGGLYPAGEGAGYAGGIVSSALDGMKQAEQYFHHQSA